jgi:hypothetical protein
MKNICYNFIKRQGYKPWYRYDPNYNTIWEIVTMFARVRSHGRWSLYVADEWRKMFDAWAFFIFKIPGFMVFRTQLMGLGMFIYLYCIFNLYSCIHSIIIKLYRYSNYSTFDLTRIIAKTSWISGNNFRSQISHIARTTLSVSLFFQLLFK